MNMEEQNKWYDSIPSDQLFLIGESLVKQAEFYTSVGVVAYTDIDNTSRSLKISGSVYKQSRKPEIVKPAFAAGLDFAFEMLNMHRVEGEVLEFHKGAQKLEMDYLGFTIEGRRRKAVYKCGTYYDALVIGMLREEWERSPRVKAYGGFCNKQFNPEMDGV